MANGPIDSSGNVHDGNGRFVSLRDYMESIIGNYEKAHEDMHRELQRAIVQSDSDATRRVEVALDAINKRLEGMNEFRKSLEDVTRDAVSRDLFDIVTNRVTVVENTYLKRFDYTQDTERLRERYAEDFVQRDRRISELEKNTVRTDALQTQADEVARTRKALTMTIIGGVILTGVNLLITVFQSAPK